MFPAPADLFCGGFSHAASQEDDGDQRHCQNEKTGADRSHQKTRFGHSRTASSGTYEMEVDVI